MSDSPQTQIDGSVSTRILRHADGEDSLRDDLLVVEEPIEIGLKTAEGLIDLGIAMRTPGDDRNLITGFLYNEGIITSAADLKGIIFKTATEATLPATRVIIELANHIPVDSERYKRSFPISSACGACGKSALESLKILRSEPLAVTPNCLNTSLLLSLGKRLFDEQSLFARTGGLHASGRFDLQGNLLELAEDVGRHNALDKLAGKAVLKGQTSWEHHLLLLSGRVGYDLMQKAIMLGCPIVAAIGAPSSLAVELASLYNITLIGFLKTNRFNTYTHPERLIPS
ncbi:MAG: formate dehydrogenase accessory sulfurtransferase FdhD [Verrucomicrobiota bacterium]